MTDSKAEKVSTRKALALAFKDRQVLAMLILGLASGLPYVVVGGTLGAWLTTVDVKPTQIGLLTWALLAYSFKFMWAAAFQSRKTPFKLKIGPRRFWMFIFLALVTVGLFALSFSNPPEGLGRIALIAVIVAFFSANFDIVLAAWRIESARDGMHLDILSTVEQFGYRIASFMGGFVALILADHIGWRPTFLAASGLMAMSVIGVMLAAPTILTGDAEVMAEPKFRQGVNLTPQTRTIAMAIVLLAWGGAFYVIAKFMFGALTDPDAHSARDFIKVQGRWIIFATVFSLGLVSALLVWKDAQLEAASGVSGKSSDATGIFSILYRAIMEPMMELIGRLKWAILLVLPLVLTYRFTDLIWGGFAYPFYLGTNFGALGHTLTEVGLASKLIGVIATILGIALGGLAMLRFGRMPVFVVGAILAALTNLLFADLASGAGFTDAFLGLTQLDHLYAFFGQDIRMARLISVIFAENVAVGLASAASIAYLSSIVNKEYAAVQYALLVSLVFLLGVLGRPAIGEIIETEGFAKAFILCALLGGVAVVFSIFEWIRISRATKPAPD